MTKWTALLALLFACGCYTSTTEVGPFARRVRVSGATMHVERCELHHTTQPDGVGLSGTLTADDCDTSSYEAPGAAASATPPAEVQVDAATRKRCAAVVQKWRTARGIEQEKIREAMSPECGAIVDAMWEEP